MLPKLFIHFDLKFMLCVDNSNNSNDNNSIKNVKVYYNKKKLKILSKQFKNVWCESNVR